MQGGLFYHQEHAGTMNTSCRCRRDRLHIEITNSDDNNFLAEKSIQFDIAHRFTKYVIV